MKFEFVNCDYCKDSKTKPIYNEGILGLSQCIRCGFVFTNPRFSQAELKKLYDEKFRIGTIEARDKLKKITCKEKTYTAYTHRELDKLKHVLESDFRLVQKYKSPGKLLDVGCGDGARLKIAYGNSWRDLYGLELSDVIVDKLKKHFYMLKPDKRFFNSSLTESSLESESFDVITLWSVLEHMNEPLESLIEVARLLKKTGIVIIRVPNIRHELVRKYVRNLILYILPVRLRMVLSITDDYRPRLNEIFDLTKNPISGKGSLDLEYHLNHFSDKTLYKFLEKAGMKVVENSYGDMIVSRRSLKDLLEQSFIRFLKYIHLISGKKLPNLSSQLLIVARKT